MAIKLTEVYAKTAQHADTAGLKISAADTSRVLACFFTVLSGLSAVEVTFIVAHGLKKALDKAVKPLKRAKH